MKLLPACLLGSLLWLGAAGEVVPSKVDQKTYPYVSFSVLGNFPYELPDPLTDGPGAATPEVPKKVRDYDKRQITVRGFMLPLDLDEKGVSQFILTASYDMCYFGAPMQMNEWVMVKMKNGQKVPFTHLPAYVSGVFSVGEEKRGPRVVSLYRMSGESIVLEK